MNTTLALIFMSVSQSLSLPPGLLSSLCYVESHHKVQAVNLNDGGSASVGVCQIKPATARVLGFRGSDTLLSRPNVNVYYAGLYLKYQLDRYNGDVEKGVSAYNAGTHRVNAKGETKNRKYVHKVLVAWEEGR